MPDIQQPGFSKLLAMIRAMDVGMLTTRDEKGNLRSRPMYTQKGEGEIVWFFTEAGSPKIHEIEDESHVNISYAAPDSQIYVSVSGLARVVRDKSRIMELWSDDALRWFPQGADTPDLALLEVRMTQAEYWDVDKRRMQQLLNEHAPGEKLTEATDHKKIA